MEEECGPCFRPACLLRESAEREVARDEDEGLRAPGELWWFGGAPAEKRRGSDRSGSTPVEAGEAACSGPVCRVAGLSPAALSLGPGN